MLNDQFFYSNPWNMHYAMGVYPYLFQYWYEKLNKPATEFPYAEDGVFHLHPEYSSWYHFLHSRHGGVLPLIDERIKISLKR
jgi:hypothetical protein